ncbi:17581_t:CDS:2 [Cetraspora pellucida]|uniref:17581_t:CDS:1 n=1 Tax=Cetraspora pellucida TaxID=1433469 RepID=A0A9N9DG88_9GLOM|nr:17581_t:CDS:2 [Cetraspora pellucida]
MQYGLALKIEKAYKNTNYNDDKDSKKSSDTLLSKTSTKSSDTLVSKASMKSTGTTITKTSIKSNNGFAGKPLKRTNSSRSQPNKFIVDDIINDYSRLQLDKVIVDAYPDENYLDHDEEYLEHDEEYLEHDEEYLDHDEKRDGKYLDRDEKRNEKYPDSVEKYFDRVEKYSDRDEKSIHEPPKKPDKVVTQGEVGSIHDDKSIDELTLLADDASLRKNSISKKYKFLSGVASLIEKFGNRDLELSKLQPSKSNASLNVTSP